MGRVCFGPSLYGPSLLWAECVMGRVCYGPSCPVTIYVTKFLSTALAKNHAKPANGDTSPIKKINNFQFFQ